MSKFLSLTDSLVLECGQLIVRELTVSSGELSHYRRVGILLRAASEVSGGDLAGEEISSLLAGNEGVSSE